jgi:arylsulfatase A-like enzyme
VPLEPGDVTVAEVLKSAGYTTALVGKWGLGNPGTTGVPTRQGFDYFYGYLDQVHAHDYYTDHLFKNEDKVSLAPGSYTHDLFTKEAREFVQRSKSGKDAPFFLYLAYTIPHANNEKKDKGMQVPSSEPYTTQPWPEQERNFAAMVTRLDRDVGALLDLLRELKLAQDTVVFFTSDNGPHKEGGHDPDFFKSSGALRGIKRAMYEGGIRVPMIVWAPGRVPAGKVSDAVWANWDVLPTLAALAGAKPPAGLDGVALGDVLRTGKSRPHAPLYWEFHENAFKQAARIGDFKAIRQAPGQPLELYDLRHDIGEATDVAARNAKVVAQMEAVIKQARTESPHWPPTPGAKSE